MRYLGEREPLLELYKLKAKTEGVPTEPRYPEPDECCGSGCIPCVFDTYEKDFEKWQKFSKKLERNLEGLKRNSL